MAHRRRRRERCRAERLGRAPTNEFYFSQWQNPSNIQTYLTLVVRTIGDPAAVASAVQAAVASLDRDLPIADILTMRQVVDRALWQPRFSTTRVVATAARR